MATKKLTPAMQRVVDEMERGAELYTSMVDWGAHLDFGCRVERVNYNTFVVMRNRGIVTLTSKHRRMAHGVFALTKPQETKP